jgi:hypothetical protein
MSDSFGAPPPVPPARSIPWDERERLGAVVALVETIKQVLFSPTDFFKAMPTTGGLWGPLAFGLIVGYLGLAVSAIYQAVFRAFFGTALFRDLGRSPELSRYAAFFQGGAGLVVELLLGPLLLLVVLFVGAGITHLFLMLLGGAKRGFEATFRVYCFIQAAAVFSLLPFCGSLIHFVYQLVLAILGIACAHGIGKGTAAAAVLLPGFILCCCCAGALAVFFGGIASLAGFAR